VFSIEIAEGEVQAIRSVVNPDKLRHLGLVSGWTSVAAGQPGG
jgi:hypothetical protein